MSDGPKEIDLNTPVCQVDDITPDEPHVVQFGGEEIAIFEQNGSYYALRNACPHQGGPLSDGKIEEGCVYCPWHGWGFELDSGAHVNGISDATAYAVNVQSEDIYLEQLEGE